jgi:hypothetical protein
VSECRACVYVGDAIDAKTTLPPTPIWQCDVCGAPDRRFTKARTRILALADRFADLPHIGFVGAAAWHLKPREERYAAPEHSGGPLTSGGESATEAADSLRRILHLGPPELSEALREIIAELDARSSA